MIIRSDYLSQVKDFIGKDVIKVITGMRRVGKSTFLDQIGDYLKSQGVPETHILSMNFESLMWEKEASSYKELYKSVALRIQQAAPGKVYLFIDEIQVVPEWERAINSLRVDFDCDIYVSGSNSKLLSSELATLLSGRYVTVQMLPFSLSEMMKAAGLEDAHLAFDLYLKLGGLPFLSQIGYQEASSVSYLRDVYNSVVLKDIAQRHGFRNADQLERVLSYFVSECGTTLSVRNIANAFEGSRRKISRDTVYNYLAAAEEAMLLTKLKRFDVKGKDIIRGEEKAYVTDLGLRQALHGNNSERIDISLENIVFSELTRRGYGLAIGRNGSKEIDFVATCGSETAYFQVCYLMESEQTREREFGAFEGIGDNYPKVVLSLDEVDFSRNGIRHMNIVDFLLKEEPLW